MIGKFPKVGPRVYGGFDADAQAFITAASITDPTQQSAINTLVVGMKNQGLWTKMKAVYPFVGGTASSHKFNLKDPRDLDAAFRLSFSGGFVHASTGILPNGTNGYADTFITANSVLTSANWHLSYYSRTNNNTAIDFDMGCGDSNGFYSSTLFIRRSNNTVGFDSGNATSANRISASSQTDSRGYYIGSIRATNDRILIKNGSNILASSTANNSNALYSLNITLFAYNQPPVLFYGSKECAFASIGDGLTNTDASNLYTLVQAFQTTLGRSVGTQTVSDADAQAFVTAADIQDQVQADAINNLVIGMKAQSLWTKMKAIYPFVGGTATSHMYNLKDPRNLDAAFRLTFSGGWTHSATGALPNGTNAYASTKLNLKNNLTNNNTHLGFYSRTSTISNAVRDIAAYQGSGLPAMALGTNTGVWISDQNDFNIRISSSIASATGFYIGTRTSSTSHKLYKNGSTLGTNTSANTQILPDINIFIGAANVGVISTETAGGYSNKESAFASIGDGLTDTDASNFYTLVQAFQTSLSRQV